MLLAALVALLAGCARERPRPATLEAVSPQIAGRQAWQFRLPGVGFPLALAVRDGKVFAAGDDGTVVALDVATGGAVRGGEVIVIEDFRLRRVLGTLLGVDLADEDDPLLPGLQISGNSVVGDTLVLADEQRAELMALFREEATSAAEDATLAQWMGRLAHRATVLVHREVDEVDLGLVRRIVELEAPAHVDVRVVTARWPFMVGVGSLVGGNAAPVLLNALYLPMAFLSGLWLPLSMLPDWLARLAPAWPAYHLAQLALKVVGHDDGHGAWLHIAVLAGVTAQPETWDVLSALLALARGLKLSAVVEGVETEAQLAVLRALGCRTVQGYLTGRPERPEALDPWLRGTRASARP